MQAQNSSATDKSGQCDHVTSQWTKSELLTQVKEFSTRTSSACSLPKLQDRVTKECFTNNNTGVTSNPTQLANVNKELEIFLNKKFPGNIHLLLTRSSSPVQLLFLKPKIKKNLEKPNKQIRTKSTLKSNLHGNPGVDRLHWVFHGILSGLDAIFCHLSHFQFRTQSQRWLILFLKMY